MVSRKGTDTMSGTGQSPMEESDGIEHEDDASQSQVMIRCSELVIPKVLQVVWKRNYHYSEQMQEFNGVCFYYHRKRQREEQEEALHQEKVKRLWKEQKRLRQEQEKLRRHQQYPPNAFALFGFGADATPDVKGTVLIPGQEIGPVCVDGYALSLDLENRRVLLILCPVTSPDMYYTVLCSVDFLPRSLVAHLGKGASKKKEHWNDVSVSTTTVKRKDSFVEYIIEGPLKNSTCDSAMLESLATGILATRGGKTVYYGVLKRPFAKGKLLLPSQIFVVTQSSDGSMALEHPSRSSAAAPENILACAVAAKNASRASYKIKTKALQAMETFAHASDSTPSRREIGLNVALGGEAAFGDYGRFVPCCVQSKSFPFPNGSFTTTPCTCDIELEPSHPPYLRNAISKRKKGHQ